MPIQTDWLPRLSGKWIAIAAATGLVGATGLVVLARKLRYYEQLQTDAPGKYASATTEPQARPLDMEEIWFCHTQSTGNLHTLTQLGVAGPPLTAAVVKKAMVKLEERHPYLRMHIVNRGAHPLDLWLEETPVRERGGGLSTVAGVRADEHFQKMCNGVHFKWPGEAQASGGSEGVASSHADRVQSLAGPAKVAEEADDSLIRVYYVTLVERAAGEGTSQLVFVFHHAFVDGSSRMSIFKDFMQYLEDAHTGGTAKVEALEMVRPLGDLLDPVQPAPPDWTIPFYSAINCVPFLWRWVCSHPLAESPGTLDRGLLAGRETRVIRLLFSEKETADILSASKANATTVHGTLSAALAVSLHDCLLRQGKFTGHRAITQHLASLRGQVRPGVGPEHVCRVFSRFYLYTDLDKKGSKTREGFWATAREFKAQLSAELLRNRKTALPFQMFGNIHARLREHVRDALTRTGFTYSISNLGNQKFKQAYGPYSVETMYTAVAEHQYGHLFAHNIVTVKNRINFAFSWYSHVMTEQEAEYYAECFRTKLLEMTAQA